MEIQPITAVHDDPIPAILPDLGAPIAHTAAPNVALTEAKAKEQESVEERAADGDPVAEIQLAKDKERHIPIDAQQLFPAHVELLVGAHEAGKGDLIDLYD